MKKVLIILLVILMSACSFTKEVMPKQVVIDYLDKYKKEHTTVIEQLKDTIENTFSTEEDKKRYTTLLLNQYKKMEYTIKDEVVEDNNAVVDVEVKVLNYGSSIKDSERYLDEHKNDFLKDSEDETTKDNTKEEIDEDKYNNYKLTQMEKVEDTVKYTIEFNLTKTDGKWEIDPLSDTDLQKLHGLYYE